MTGDRRVVLAAGISISGNIRRSESSGRQQHTIDRGSGSDSA
jgi:hypothetical protein